MSYLASAELYDLASGSWSLTGSLYTARAGHTVTLLPNGKVLLAGGSSYGNSYLNSAELYDPTSGSWIATGSLNGARASHTATLLPNGKVLVSGGVNGSGPVSSSELYDPASGSWITTGSLNTARSLHTATLLPNGKVLVVGGSNSISGYLNSSELYDPAGGSWSATGSLNTARRQHTATLLANGKVLVAGGYNSISGSLSSAELYDPTSGSWTATVSLNTERELYTATLLPNGKVLAAEGLTTGFSFTSAELYDVGLGFVRPDWQPQIATATSPLQTGSRLILTGLRFKGISQASGGNYQDSSTNYPIVQLRDIDNSQVAFLPVDSIAGWSDTAFTSTQVNYNFPPGPALVTVFTNGIPSDSKYLLVTSGTPAVTSAVSRKTHGGAGDFDIDLPFTGTPGLESRTGGSTNDYTMVITFAGNVNVTGNPQAQVTMGTATIGSNGVPNGGIVTVNGNVVTIPLTLVANVQTINVRLNGVTGASDAPAVDVDIPMAVLVGDVNANRVVNATDVALTKSQVGMAVSSSNFREDVNANGTISSTDVAIVKSDVGTGLP